MYLAVIVHKSNCSKKKKLLILVLYLVRLICGQREVYFTKQHAPQCLRCTLLAFGLQKNSPSCYTGKDS